MAVSKTTKGGMAWKTLLLIIAILTCVAGSGLAEEPISILPINPVPEIRPEIRIDKSFNIDEIKFAGGGLIERIDKDIIVIGDTMRQIASDLTYHSGITGLAASRSEFRIGAYVGYQLNDKRQIVSLWLLKED
ncbi:MAG: hypothetical protein U9Q38_05330 [Thermodesulfobacteriota bacterium]|nr:hypothetical protein [Thermodesulfobacteriota bacterium]